MATVRGRLDAPIVELSGLAVGYDGQTILRDLNLSIERGELIGIVGPSGSGKTTMLRALFGEMERYAGTFSLGSNNGQTARIGYVPQVETVDWNFPITVEQVVLQGRWRARRWLPWFSQSDRAWAHAVMEHLGIAHLAKRSIRALSGGQQQRVFLARALVGSRDLVLLDEPTSGLDIKTSHEVLHELAQLNVDGVTVVLTTHDLNGVASHLPRLICLGENTILADGPPEEVLQPGVLERAYGQPMLVVRRGHDTYVVPVPEEAPGAHPHADHDHEQDHDHEHDHAELSVVDPAGPGDDRA